MAPELDVALKNKRRKRPIILTIVGLLLFFRVLLISAIAIFLFTGEINIGSEHQYPQAVNFIAAVFLAGLDLLLLATAIGFMMLKKWAWKWNLMIMGFLLISDLWVHFTDTSHIINDLSLLLNILIVFYLVNNDIHELFEDMTETMVLK